MAMRMWIVLAALAGAAAAQEKPRGFLGVRIGPLDAENRAALGIRDSVTEGVLLLEAMPDLPAAKAGLRKGDVIVKFAGEPVRTPDDLVALVRARAAGDEVQYTARRGDGTIDGKLTLAAAPEAPPEERTIEERLDRVQRDIEELDKRLKKRTLSDWLRAEEGRLDAARAKGDREGARKAQIRLELLREMEAEGARGTEERLDRIERKLDRILERLGER